MYTLFTDKNEIFECDITLEGATLDNSQARLIIESQDISLIFKGNILADGKCQIPIKKLKGLINENIQGNIKLEVIADDTYFVPWESEFIVEVSKKVTVEVKSSTKEPIFENKPRISVNIPKKNHTINLLKLLMKENITIDNISAKKKQLNQIIETYIKENTIELSDKGRIIEGLLEGLRKFK